MVDLLNRDVRFLLLEMSSDGVVATLTNESELINRSYEYFESKKINKQLNIHKVILKNNLIKLYNMGGPLRLTYPQLQEGHITKEMIDDLTSEKEKTIMTQLFLQFIIT